MRAVVRSADKRVALRCLRGHIEGLGWLSSGQCSTTSGLLCSHSGFLPSTCLPRFSGFTWLMIMPTSFFLFALWYLFSFIRFDLYYINIYLVLFGIKNTENYYKSIIVYIHYTHVVIWLFSIFFVGFLIWFTCILMIAYPIHIPCLALCLLYLTDCACRLPLFNCDIAIRSSLRLMALVGHTSSLDGAHPSAGCVNRLLVNRVIHQSSRRTDFPLGHSLHPQLIWQLAALKYMHHKVRRMFIHITRHTLMYALYTVFHVVFYFWSILHISMLH